MTHKHKRLLVTAIAIFLAALYSVKPAEEPEPSAEPTLSHKQEVWMYALEWCESNGDVTAINAEDLDGTPSYYSWQFKPSTFRHFGTLYGIIATSTTNVELMELLKDYELQKAIVTQMILHRDEIQWDRQFPWCVKKLGWPPKN